MDSKTDNGTGQSDHHSALSAIRDDDLQEDDEDMYLCKLFGTEGRFVKFCNQTGRPIRLTSKLVITNFEHMTWSSRAIIHPFQSHAWRFLDESQTVSIYSLSLLPDPYHTAKQNSFSWKFEYVDPDETSEILALNKKGPLGLQELEDIEPGDTVEVNLHRCDKGVPSLTALILDKILYNQEILRFTPNIVPGGLKASIEDLNRHYEEIWNNAMKRCKLCKEIHM